MIVLGFALTACSPISNEYQATTSSQTSHTPTVRPCTKEYVPICAEVAIECVTTPCESIKQTFPNSCLLSNNKKATFLYKGVCKK